MVDPTMISEKKFVESYSSFWRTLLPLGEPVVRAVNKNVEQFASPMNDLVGKSRYSPVSELSHQILEEACLQFLSVDQLELSKIKEIAERTTAHISAISKTQALLFNDEEITVAQKWAERLYRYLSLRR